MPLPKLDLGWKSISKREGVRLSGSVWGKVPVIVVGILALFLAGCGTAASPTSTPAPTAVPPTPTATEAPTATDRPEPSSEASVPTTGATIEVANDSVARYLVAEQLARLDLPTDAVGETSDVTGSIVFNADGTVDSSASTITVDLTTLHSDEDRRDRYLRGRSLQSDTFPKAEFVVRETPGLPWPLPADGEVNFQIVGDMTLHGVTRPLTWDATANFSGNIVSGQAQTNFTFEEFNMDKPSVSVILSVDDDIRLELDFVGSVSQE